MITIYKSLADKTNKELKYKPLVLEHKEDMTKETTILASTDNLSLLQELDNIRNEISKSNITLKLLSEFTPEELKNIQSLMAGKDGKEPTQEDMMKLIKEGLISIDQINRLNESNKDIYKPSMEQVMTLSETILDVLGVPKDISLNMKERAELLDLTLNNEYNFF